MPHHYKVELCRRWEPTRAAGEWAELRWGVQSTLARKSHPKTWKDCVFARESIAAWESVVAVRCFGRRHFVTSSACLRQEYPVPKRVHG